MPKKSATTADPEQPPIAMIRVESVPVDSLHLDPANARRHPERNVEAIRSALARFGQQTPLVIDGDNIVRKGNGTLLAARALGWEMIDVHRTWLKGSEATAYAIADNRTSELAEWDDIALAETLRALQSEDFDLSAVGYRDDEVDAILEGLAREHVGANGDVVDDPAGEWQGMPEFENEAAAARVIKICFPTSDDVTAFGKSIGRDIGPEIKSIWFPQKPDFKSNGAEWVSEE
jgi:hypothetical protein